MLPQVSQARIPVVVVWECHQCFAHLPYLGASHNCPERNWTDEGFCEEDGFMEAFLRWKSTYEQTGRIMVVVVEAPDPVL